MILLGALILVGACSSSGGGAGEGRVHVIATTSILGDVVSRIGGSLVQIDVMIPTGVDPHDFSPSAQQVAAISSADLIVANGLDLEEGLGDVLAQAISEGITVIEVGEEIDPLTSVETGPGDEMADEPDRFDPHFWQDPIRMRAAVDLITSEVVAAGVPEAAASGSEYRAEIDATDAEIVALLAPIPPGERLLVTNHDAFAYFADRYDFKVIGTIIPGGSTLAEPSSAEIAELVKTIIANDVPAIFVENIGSSSLANVLAEETGREIEVVPLISDALGEAGTETGTYLGMILYNATAIANALGG